jgi:hypothetical protein
MLTNSFAVEGLRALAAAATRLNLVADAATWTSHRTDILAGIETHLTYSDATNTAGAQVYGELRGAVRLSP